MECVITKRGKWKTQFTCHLFTLRYARYLLRALQALSFLKLEHFSEILYDAFR